MAAKLTVNLTPSFRLTSDGERNYSIEQRVTVDPAKSPTFYAKLKTDPNAVPDAPYDDWREIDRHYPMTERGLASALLYVINRQSVMDAAAEAEEEDGVVELRRFAEIMSVYSWRINSAINNVMKGGAGDGV